MTVMREEDSRRGNKYRFIYYLDRISRRSDQA
jgi:hypothetical protein